jgi:hypothetical protein
MLTGKDISTQTATASILAPRIDFAMRGLRVAAERHLRAENSNMFLISSDIITS